MNLQLHNKTALVTGSTAGIGYSIAESLLKEGATVIINGRTQERVDAAIESLKKQNPSFNAKGFVGDLSDSNTRLHLTQEIKEIDILINNLGVYEAKQLSDIHEKDWTRMFETNVLSGAALSQFYLKKMKEKNWGRIIFIASEAGVNIPEDMIHYGVSKAAQIALSRGLAETTKGTNVTVNSILPGPTLSEGVSTFLSNVIKDPNADREAVLKQFIEKLRPTSLIQRFATSEEVASLVTYISSPLSSATNGAALRVEGGLLRTA